jgi:exodeoxyribonuclease-3
MVFTYWDAKIGPKEMNYGERLDYFIASKYMAKAIVDSDIHNEYGGSSHCPISVTIDLNVLSKIKN